MSLMLDSSAVKSQNIPLEYNLRVMNRDTQNTFIFTEQDLPGYNSKSASTKLSGQTETASIPRIPARPNMPQRSGQGPNRIDKNKKWQPYFRKAIPSRRHS